MTAEERSLAMKEKEKNEERKKADKKKKGFDMFADGDQILDETDVSKLVCVGLYTPRICHFTFSNSYFLPTPLLYLPTTRLGILVSRFNHSSLFPYFLHSAPHGIGPRLRPFASFHPLSSQIRSISSTSPSPSPIRAPPLPRTGKQG